MSRAEVVEHFVPVHSELEHKTVEHFDLEHKTAEHMDPGPLQKLPAFTNQDNEHGFGLPMRDAEN